MGLAFQARRGAGKIAEDAHRCSGLLLRIRPAQKPEQIICDNALSLDFDPKPTAYSLACFYEIAKPARKNDARL
jgi:hypothetical protein